MFEQRTIMDIRKKAEKFIDIVVNNLKDFDSVKKLARSRPVIYYASQIYLAELDLAIIIFNDYRKKMVVYSTERALLINCQKLTILFKNRNLPRTEDMLALFFGRSKLTEKIRQRILKELRSFDFLNEKNGPQILLGRLILAIYRTYVLNIYPDVREKGGQVASTIEEMSAILAINKIKTNLFLAARQWLLDWQREGFSEKLARRMERIKI